MIEAWSSQRCSEPSLSPLEFDPSACLVAHVIACSVHVLLMTALTAVKPAVRELLQQMVDRHRPRYAGVRAGARGFASRVATHISRHMRGRALSRWRRVPRGMAWNPPGIAKSAGERALTRLSHCDTRAVCVPGPRPISCYCPLPTSSSFPLHPSDGVDDVDGRPPPLNAAVAAARHVVSLELHETYTVGKHNTTVHRVAKECECSREQLVEVNTPYIRGLTEWSHLKPG